MDLSKQWNLLGSSLSAKLWLGLAAAVLVAAASLIGVGYGFGYAAAGAEGSKALAKLNKDVAEAQKKQLADLAALNEKYRQQEITHAQEVADLRAEFAKEEGKQQAVDARSVADLRSGDQQLRLPVRTCQAAVTSASVAAASRADAAARAELAPETSAALYGIAAEGDASIREHNALIEWAEKAVTQCGLIVDPLPETKGTSK